MQQKRSRTASTIINTIAGIGSRFCNSILSFVLRTVFIYTLGIQYTGVSSVFTDILTMMSLSELGISTAIAAALYSPLRTGDEERIRKLMQFYRNAYRFISAFIMCVGLLLLPVLNYIITDVPDIKESIYVIFILYVVKTAASYLLVYKSTLLNADQKGYIVKGFETACTLVRYLVEIGCLFVFRNYMTYLVIEVVATIIQNYIVTKRAEKEYPYAFVKSKDKLSREELKSLFKDIKGLAMYQLSASVGNSIDNVLVSSFISTTTVGLLSNYTLIKNQLSTLIKQFYSAVVPSIGNVAAEKDADKQYIIFNRIFYLSFIVMNFVSVSMFVIFNPFITVWLGEDYLLGEEIGFIIAFDFFLYILLQAIASFRTANGLFVKGQYRPLIMAVLNIILSVIMIQRWGIFGTIFATVVCRLATQWYDPFLLFKYVFNKPFLSFYRRYWSYILMFFICAAITYILSSVLCIGKPITDLLIKCCLCAIVPNGIAVLLTHRSKEFKYLCEFVTNKVKRR